MENRPGSPNRKPKLQQSVPPRPPDGTAPCLALVSGSTITLSLATARPTPPPWQAAMMRLAQSLDLDIRLVPQRAPFGLRQAAAWASSALGRSAAPVFAPWHCWSPVALQPVSRFDPPRASWISSYAFGLGTGGRLQRDVIDILLMSPTAYGCMKSVDADEIIPRPQVLQAMIEAARREGRQKLAIVTDALRRNAIIRHLLLLDQSITRDGMEIEIVLIDNALNDMARNPASADAIIVLPDLRSEVFAMLAEATGIDRAWPMQWRHRDVCIISSEALETTGSDLRFNAPLLLQTLALAANQAGLSNIARHLAEGSATLSDRELVTTSSSSSITPHRTEIGDENLIDQLCRTVTASPRSVAKWKAIPQRTAPLSLGKIAGLSAALSKSPVVTQAEE